MVRYHEGRDNSAFFCFHAYEIPTIAEALNLILGLVIVHVIDNLDSVI